MLSCRALLMLFFVRTVITLLGSTVNFLNIRTPEKFVIITLKFELCGSAIE